MTNRLAAIEQGIRPVLDLLDPEAQGAQAAPPPPPEAFIIRCQNSWSWMKQYVCDAGEFVAAHVLGVVRSHYPGVST